MAVAVSDILACRRQLLDHRMMRRQMAHRIGGPRIARDQECLAAAAAEIRIQKRVAELLQEWENIHNQATAKAVEATALTKEWVITKLIENANRAMQAEAHRSEDGKPIGEYSYNGAVANRALELLGKELGMFIDRKEVGSPGEFERMTDEELLGEVRRQAAEFLQLNIAKVH
jgi:hypothetical protein